MVKKEEDSKFRFELNLDCRSARFFAILFPTIYLVAVSIFCVVYRIIPGPEFLVLGILIYAGYSRRTWRVLKDWLPLITVFFSYEIMYSFVGTVSQYNLHTGPHNFDLQVFGQIPSLFLQQTLKIPILDYIGGFFYLTYFFVPTIFAFVLWRESPKNYSKFTVAFGICTYSALITFLFYPVAPPWIGVPNVARILTGSLDVNLGVPVYRTLFDFLSPNLYAAFPSMHSALPWLVFLFASKIWKWKALPLLLLPVGTWFSAIYLGEHYVVDVLGGIAYATAAFAVVERILPLLSGKIGFLKKYVYNQETGKSNERVRILNSPHCQLTDARAAKTFNYPLFDFVSRAHSNARFCPKPTHFLIVLGTWLVFVQDCLQTVARAAFKLEYLLLLGWYLN